MEQWCLFSSLSNCRWANHSGCYRLYWLPRHLGWRLSAHNRQRRPLAQARGLPDTDANPDPNTATNNNADTFTHSYAINNTHFNSNTESNPYREYIRYYLLLLESHSWSGDGCNAYS